MCGLAGVVQFTGAATRPGLVSALDAPLAHRGPDGRGAFHSASGRALLVHRRLAIIDPSPDSNQPLCDAGGRWHLAYNGEIYNYRELRAELLQEGASFATSGDTEVLLQLLVRRGPSALGKVRGMFAFALWDEREQALLIARDRFGIKPLYLAREPERIVFGSELRALRAACSRRSISPAAVLAFLRWGSVLPPLSWDDGVELLDPGSWCRWDRDGRQTSGRFACLSWNREPDRASAISDAETERLVHDAIRSSVAAHLVSDVPVALFLSGGLDSASLLAAATDGGHQLECFSVIDTAHQGEGEAAEAVASALGVRWHPLKLDAQRVGASIPKAVEQMDQPSIDGPNAWVIARAVSHAGVKTALSGTGADELFGGYPTSRLLPLWNRLGAATPVAARSVAAIERALGRGTRAARLDHVAATASTLRERYRAIRGFLLPHELASLVGPRLRGADGESAAVHVDAIESAVLGDGEERLPMSVARAETQVYLRSQLLRDLDVMSMAHGLEVRVPFVDHVLLETAWPRMASSPKLLARKAILRRLLEGRVPPHVLTRPKTGFTLPFDVWMRGELADFTREGIRAAERSGWIAAHEGDRIWREWQGGRQHWSRAWGLAVLGHHVAPA